MAKARPNPGSELLRLAAEAAQVYGWVWDIAADELSWTVPPEPLLGPLPAGGRYPDFRDLVHPEDRAGFLAVGRAAMNSLSAARRAVDYSQEFRVVRTDGEPRWLLARGQAQADACGRPVRFVGVTVDIHERKMAEEEIRRLNASLEQRVRERTAALEATLKELESFSYCVSHDLRAPLRAMGSFARLIADEEGERLSAEGRRKLAVVEANAVHMGRLVDDLLALARLSRAPLAREPVDVGALAASVLEELRPRYSAAEVAAGELPRASADPILLRQALFNLIDNAFKYSSRSPAPRIEIGWDGAARAYFVRDNGVGFDMRYGGKLFGTFERLHPQSDFPGTGIGLAIVKRVLERHGGRVWAESAPGAGASFYFSLPS